MDAIGRLVRDGTSMATAFIVTSDGLAATAEHVIGARPDGWAFEPLTAPGLSFPVEAVLASDARADVALLRVAGAEGWRPLPLAGPAGVRPGSPVHLRGFARSLDYDSGVGQYVGGVSEHGQEWVKVSCRHAQPGMSGAPVLLTGTGSSVLGLVSSRLNAERWNRDSVLLADAAALVALAPERLRLAAPVRRGAGGTLRLSWDRGTATEALLETDVFTVSLGRNEHNDIRLPDSRDSRFHGQLTLDGTQLVYRHRGTRPAFLVSATRQLRLDQGGWCVVGDKDRLRFASGTILVEFSAPDLYDPNAGPTANDEEDTDGAR